jgi:hypothetical protein
VIEFARPRDISLAAFDGLLPTIARYRSEALDEARWDRRRAGDLGRKCQKHLAGAEQLREVVRGETDPTFGQIESEIEPHRAAEPGVGAALRRPSAFDQSAKHNPVAVGQTRFKQAENPHAQARAQRQAHDTAGQHGGE